MRNRGCEKTIVSSHRKVNKTQDELWGLSPRQDRQALSRSVNCNAVIYNFFQDMQLELVDGRGSCPLLLSYVVCCSSHN